jgi:hypothetical protein
VKVDVFLHIANEFDCGKGDINGISIAVHFVGQLGK